MTPKVKGTVERERLRGKGNTCRGDEIAPHLRRLEEKEKYSEVASNNNFFVLPSEFCVLGSYLDRKKIKLYNTYMCIL